MQGYYKRINIDVECIINASGKLHLLAFYWGDKRYEITEQKMRVFAQNNTGNPCNLYTVMVDGNEKKIYFDGGVFFVEARNGV